MKLNSMIRFAGRSCSALAMFGVALAADPLLTNTTIFRIPFAVDGAGPGVSGSAVLFSGVNDSPMEQVQTVNAQAGGFKFTAPSDGKYSFAVRMTDANGDLIGNEESLIPELEVVVDTIAPRLNFQLADMGRGNVIVTWNSNETGVDPGSLRMEYAEGADGRWKPITTTPSANGQASISAQAGTSIEVRGFISDLAGNQGTGSAQTVLSQTANSASQQQDTPADSIMTIPGNSQAVGPSPFANDFQQQSAQTNSFPNPAQVLPSKVSGVQSPPIQAPPSQINNSMNQMNQMAPLVSSPPMTGMSAPQGFVADSYGSTTPGKTNFANSGSADFGLGNIGSVRPAAPTSNYPPRQQFNQFGQHPPSNFRQPTQMQIGGQSGYASNNPGFPNSGPASESRQIVSSQVFNIDYRVDDVGVSGVSDVELFVTENNGREWFRYGKDADLQSPFEVDTRGEGTFGFAVRASNGLGFSQAAPQPGEQPNIVVTVDKKAPVVELGRPQVVVSNGGRIRMAWRVSEPNPSDSPIRLEYSASNSGPWTPLFDWQVDTGGYEMAIQPGMPHSVHFRLLARDVAGNVTASQTNQPVLIDQRRPTARLLRVQPVSNGRRFGL